MARSFPAWPGCRCRGKRTRWGRLAVAKRASPTRRGIKGALPNAGRAPPDGGDEPLGQRRIVDHVRGGDGVTCTSHRAKRRPRCARRHDGCVRVARRAGRGRSPYQAAEGDAVGKEVARAVSALDEADADRHRHRQVGLATGQRLQRQKITCTRRPRWRRRLSGASSCAPLRRARRRPAGPCRS